MTNRPTLFGDKAGLASRGARLPRGCELVVAVDSMVADIHFPRATTAFDLGYKALAVNLSDLAAMGAEPLEARLAVVAPSPDLGWLGELESGFGALAERYALIITGADLSAGPLVVTVQVYGTVPQASAITRNGARPGDHIFVTGTLGDAGVGLAILTQSMRPAPTDHAFFVQRLTRPTPRAPEGMVLRKIASAAIDISDGLTTDLARILTASNVGATVEIESLPLSQPMLNTFDPEPAWRYALSSGDDYELCFTCAPAQLDGLHRGLRRLGAHYTGIGVIEEQPGIRFSGGNLGPETVTGYEHFV